MRLPFIQESNHDSHVPKIDETENQFDKDLSSTINLDECVHKHRKHKKRKKHKKHHRKPSLRMSAVIDNDHKKENYKSFQGEDQTNFDFNRVNNNIQKENNCPSETLIETTLEKKDVSKLQNKNMESEAVGLYDEDSSSNVVSEVSDKVRMRLITYYLF